MGLSLLTATGALAQVFGPVTSYSAGLFSYPAEVVLCDVNLDGIPDIVTGNNTNGNGISVLLGLGDGRVGPATTYSLGTSTLGIAVGDLNGDERPDVVAGDYSGGRVTVVLGQAGGFGPPTSYSTGGTLVTNVGVADITGDGRLDVVANNTNSNTFSVLSGLGNGALAPAVVYAGGPPAVGKMLVRDISGDGQPDVIIMNSGVNGLGVALGDVNGQLAPMHYYPTGNKFYYYAMTFGDVNGDDVLDAVVCSGNNHEIGLLLGQPGGSFGPMTAYATGPGFGPQSVATGDVNGDGRTDIVALDYNSNLLVMLGQAGGGMGPVGSYATNGLTGTAFAGSQLVLGDLNNDGRLDAVVANDQSGTVKILLGMGPAIPMSLTKPAGSIGDTLALQGLDLTGTSRITFAGTQHNVVTTGFKVNAAGTRISGIAVPAGAQTGPVRITTLKGTVSSQQPFAVTQASATSLQDRVHLYPNPTRGQLAIALPPGQQLANAWVLNILGQEVARPIPASTINLGALPQGIYLLKLLVGSEVVMKRVVME